MIQSDDFHWSFTLSIHRRVYNTCLPSGESCGSCTSSQSRYCSSDSEAGEREACSAACCWAVRVACWAYATNGTTISVVETRRVTALTRMSHSLFWALELTASAARAQERLA